MQTRMRRAPLTSTRRYFRLSFAAGAFMVLASAAGVTADPAAVERLTGTGTWGPDGGPAAPANATWLLIGEQVHAFAVEQNGTRYDCYAAPPPTAATARCAAEPGGNGTYRFVHRADEREWTGHFTAQTRVVLLAAPGATAPSPWPGFIVSTIAATLLIATVLLAVLLVQERRVARYLVRRLYEETRGRLPADWPENLRQQWIARIFIRGKN